MSGCERAGGINQKCMNGFMRSRALPPRYVCRIFFGHFWSYIVQCFAKRVAQDLNGISCDLLDSFFFFGSQIYIFFLSSPHDGPRIAPTLIIILYVCVWIRCHMRVNFKRIYLRFYFIFNTKPPYTYVHTYIHTQTDTAESVRMNFYVSALPLHVT